MNSVARKVNLRARSIYQNPANQALDPVNYILLILTSVFHFI